MEGFSGLVGLGIGCAVDGDLAGACGDFHILGSSGSEVVGARVDDAEGFAGAIGEMDGVGYYVAIEIDVGYGVCGDVLERGHVFKFIYRF